MQLRKDGILSHTHTEWNQRARVYMCKQKSHKKFIAKAFATSLFTYRMSIRQSPRFSLLSLTFISSLCDSTHPQYIHFVVYITLPFRFIHVFASFCALLTLWLTLQSVSIFFFASFHSGCGTKTSRHHQTRCELTNEKEFKWIFYAIIWGYL